jgi:hypothetical protein
VALDLSRADDEARKSPHVLLVGRLSRSGHEIPDLQSAEECKLLIVDIDTSLQRSKVTQRPNDYRTIPNCHMNRVERDSIKGFNIRL